MAGTLLSFHAAFSDKVSTCFLGVTLQRPKTQTLMFATINNEGQLNFECDGSQTPSFATSRELFCMYAKDYLQSVEGKDDKDCSQMVLTLDILQFNVAWEDGHQLVGVTDGVRETYELLPQRRVRSKRPPGELPFGLKLPRKKRKVTGGKKRGSQRKHSGQQPAVLNSASSAGGDSNNANEDNSGDSGQEYDDKQEIVQTGPAGQQTLDINEESELVNPISDIAATEERAAKNLETEIQQNDEKRSELAMSLQSSGVAQKTFFSKQLGLDTGAVAVSGRSICLCCKTRINKSDIRFSWFHNRLRPSAWLHAHCVIPMTDMSGLREETINKLTEIVSAGSGSASSSSHVAPSSDAVKAKAAEILKMLCP